MRRIGLYGGTFDPPHGGHVVVARAAADAVGLDEVVWAPVGRQPLKQEQPVASFEERLEMVGLLCAADARFRVSALDGPRPDGGLNYTVDLLERMREEFADADLWCVIGADSARDLKKWKSPERLMELARWIVVSRPDVSDEEALRAFPEGSVVALRDVAEDVSASELREKLLHGEDVSALIPPAVLRYIEQHGLYQ